MKNAVRFLTIFCSVMTLSALMAHLFELPAKMFLVKEDYQVVQGIYRGWQWLGIFEVGAILLTFVWAMMVRKEKGILPFILSAFTCFVISIVIFFAFTFPANQVTANWTNLPAEWEDLRKEWEYSHAARALINLAGFFLLIVAILRTYRRN